MPPGQPLVQCTHGGVPYPPHPHPSRRRRHNLPVLRADCLECLLHLLVAPGCTGRGDEPGVQSLDLGSLRQVGATSEG